MSIYDTLNHAPPVSTECSGSLIPLKLSCLYCKQLFLALTIRSRNWKGSFSALHVAPKQVGTWPLLPRLENEWEMICGWMKGGWVTFSSLS